MRAGEIVGVAGLIGSGRSEWAQALFSGGLKGTIRLRGASSRRSLPTTAGSSGSAYVPGDRKTQGLFPDLSVRENLTITLLDRLAGALGILQPARGWPRWHAR